MFNEGYNSQESKMYLMFGISLMTADLMCGRPRACPSSCAATSLKWVPRPHQPGDSTQSSSPADTWIHTGLQIFILSVIEWTRHRRSGRPRRVAGRRCGPAPRPRRRRVPGLRAPFSSQYHIITVTL